MKNTTNFILFFVVMILITACSTKPGTDKSPKDNQVTAQTTTEKNSETTTEGITETINQYSLEEFQKHNTKEDCWIVYEGKIYDYTSAPRHASMDKTFFRHCGQISGFEEGAKGKHSGSNEARVSAFGNFVGELV